MKTAFFQYLAAFIVVGLISGSALASGDDLNGTVGYVVDGDTFDLGDTRIRIWGIDTPEMGEPGGREAKEWLIALILRKGLTCLYVDTDRYRRTVAQCFLSDGRDIAAALLVASHAVQYCRYSRGYYDGVSGQEC
jgi:endonuclease YncB( thermonuclease family)